MLRFICAIAYILIFLPIWALRRVTGGTRFGPRFHKGRSAWDRPVAGVGRRR